MNLVRGYWEQGHRRQTRRRDRKNEKPATPQNIIFEDTQTAFSSSTASHPVRRHKAAGKLPSWCSSFRYVEPEIEEFEQAVEEFKERSPTWPKA